MNDFEQICPILICVGIILWFLIGRISDCIIDIICEIGDESRRCEQEK